MSDHISSTGQTCDRCRVAQAQVIYQRSLDDVWRFCSHHAEEHDEQLTSLGYRRRYLAATVPG